jgi:hypothetical protein
VALAFIVLAFLSFTSFEIIEFGDRLFMFVIRFVKAVVAALFFARNKPSADMLPRLEATL